MQSTSAWQRKRKLLVPSSLLYTSWCVLTVRAPDRRLSAGVFWLYVLLTVAYLPVCFNGTCPWLVYLLVCFDGTCQWIVILLVGIDGTCSLLSFICLCVLTVRVSDSFFAGVFWRYVLRNVVYLLMCLDGKCQWLVCCTYAFFPDMKVSIFQVVLLETFQDWNK